MAITSCRRVSPLLLPVKFAGLCTVTSAQAQQKTKQETWSDQANALPSVYQNWVDEDVRWIITPDEKSAFVRLASDADRDRFVIQFWLRRDPTPDTAENEYKEEHYRRIAYSNVHFAGKVRGSLTDRGRTYIVDGPPDRIVKAKGIALDAAHPTEVWQYLAVPGHEKEVKFSFDDDGGDYLLTK
jgi:GWxTD domain-containing protein